MSPCHRRGWRVLFDVDLKAFRVRIVAKLGWLGSSMSNLSGMSTMRDISILSNRGSVGVLIISRVNSMVCKGGIQAPCLR